ncbi:YdcF family protein [Candidatus Kaiserbacteria bacterium]|nr:YdcF family protein [Candidatus Kaiserbacteria bacterium]
MTLETPKKDDTESFANPETKLPRADCLALLGRGVVRVSSGEEEHWKLSRYIEEVEPGREGGSSRTGEQVSGAISELPQENLIISGGTAGVLGALQYLEEVEGKKPLVVMAAGRPPYLKNAPEEMSEGSVMKRELLRRLDESPEVIVNDDKNTYEGVLHSLQTAQERGRSSIVFTTIELHMPRVKELHKYIVQERPELRALKAYFVTAEDLLRRRYAGYLPRLEAFERIQQELHESDAWKRMWEREQRGVQDLKEGTYRRDWKDL